MKDILSTNGIEKTRAFEYDIGPEYDLRNYYRQRAIPSGQSSEGIHRGPWLSEAGHVIRDLALSTKPVMHYQGKAYLCY